MLATGEFRGISLLADKVKKINLTGAIAPAFGVCLQIVA